MASILVLATAGLKSGQLDDIEHQLYPRVDYLELRQHIDIDIINYDVYNKTRLGSYTRYWETQLRSDLYLTYLGLLAQKRYAAVFTMSERAGLPFACIRKLSNQHAKLISMFQSWSWRQELVVKQLKLYNQMNTIAVHCTSMQRKLTGFGAINNKITIVPYSTDEKFFSLPSGSEQIPNMILTVGETRSRNYSLLFKAITDLPVTLIAATSGMWYAREKKPRIDVKVPDNTAIVKNLPIHLLRKLYAECNFVVLPVYEQVSSAGVTTVLEAACMQRTVISTRSPGLMDFIEDGETGIFVEPNNVDELREAILFLLAHPEEARRMGQNARQRVEEIHYLDNYVRALANLITQAL